MLSRLADGTLPHPRTVGLRRHVATCVACEDVVDALAKGRRLSAGLPVLAMPDDAREAMLDRVAARATAVLPTVEEVLTAIEEDDDVKPAVSPMLVVAAIVLALLLGVGVAALTRSSGTDTLQASSPVATPSVEPTLFTPSDSPSVTPSASASTSASPSASRTPSAKPTASPSVVVNPAVRVSPTSGPRGTSITVAGTGWAPGDQVSIRYTGPVSSSRATAVADSRGRFRVTLSANGLVPGDYTVQASGSSGTASASFRQTS
jgi:hypothetical protein